MILEKEIGLINDERIRNAVKNCIQKYESDLYNYPASIGGTYHPPEERGPGGLPLHIGRLVRIIHENLKTHLGLTSSETDLITASAILHDIGNIPLSKRDAYGCWTRNHKVYSEWHGEYSWATALPYFEEQGFKQTDDLMLQLKAIIESHMGYWMPNAKKPTRKLELIFTMLDYVDTRPWVHIDLVGGE